MTTEPMSVARVRILELPASADRVYDYAIPPELSDRVRIGSLAKVQFGALKRTALVVGLSDSSEYSALKPLISLADERYSLSDELMGVCAFLCERTFCSTGEAVQTVMPSGVTDSLYHAKRDPVERFYTLIADTSKVRLGRVEARVVEALYDSEKTLTYLKDKVGASTTVLNNLVKKQIISFREEEIYRNPYSGREKTVQNIELSVEQSRAADELSELALSKKACAALLFGVTGSGKTSVIKTVIDSVIGSGRTVIMLVPEISLTGQTVDFLCGCFGERVAVIHSGLSEGERLDAFKRIRAHMVDLVIGTRSAVFAPLDDLGMIVIDEEQEHTYKSDMNPKYHARDIARYRCAKNNALMLLASATPSLESFRKAEEGIYKLVRLNERYGDAVLPDVIISDLREETSRGNISPVGTVLRSELEKNLSRGEQSILFVGRRGYNNFISCKMCGEVIECPNCSVSLTYHRDHGSEQLKCHYCGYVREIPDICPKCGSEHLDRKGFGTQLVAEELSGIFPNARILRMDADAASGKFSHEHILNAFRDHSADILIGTQMVTKGHNFPDVTLVGVINADSALYLDDFRATERTFDLLTQVIGRAGRGKKAGRAVLQTYSPENDTIRFAARQDYEGFYSGAIKLRKQLVFPPFCDFVLIILTCEEEQAVMELSVRVDRRIRELLCGEYSDISAYIFGPMEAPIYRVNRVYRMRLILKCSAGKRMRDMLRLIQLEFAKEKAQVNIDINSNLL